MISNSTIKSDNPIMDIQNELSMFEQTTYCESYIKNKFDSIEEEQIKYQAKIASSCFRQAKEYYNAGNLVSISTKPLLLSYALNNYAKGLCYLFSIDSSIHKGFLSHGFKINTTKSILDASITLKTTGAVLSLDKVIHEETLPSKSILPLTTLLSHIPGLNNVIHESADLISNIANYKNGNYIVNLFENPLPPSFTNNLINIRGYVSKEYLSNEYIWEIIMTAGSLTNIESMSGISFPFFEYIVVPTMIGKKEVIIQPMIACYLLMMSYSMYVRYHAEVWEDLIDPKISSLYRMIYQSIDCATTTFITDIHRLLLSKHIVKHQYDDNDVEKYIDQNISNISKKIDKELGNLIRMKERGM